MGSEGRGGGRGGEIHCQSLMMSLRSQQRLICDVEKILLLQPRESENVPQRHFKRRALLKANSKKYRKQSREKSRRHERFSYFTCFKGCFESLVHCGRVAVTLELNPNDVPLTLYRTRFCTSTQAVGQNWTVLARY